MASSLSYVEFVREQMSGAGTISYRRMFGEYGLYCDGKYFACICGDRLLVKVTPAGEALLPGCPRGIPYEGGGEMLLPDVEDRETLEELVRVTCAALPGKKRRVEKKEKETASMDKIDYKKTEKHLYMPKKPAIVQVPEMVFFAVDGQGDPNTSPDYAEAIAVLYGLSFTVKMSRMSGEEPEGYFAYVVPPLEGLWWTEDPAFDGKAPADKNLFRWTALIRQPDFVTEDVFLWAREQLAHKKPELNLLRSRFLRWEEGLCAHLLHTGPYDGEPASIDRLDAFLREQGCQLDFSETRRHHEIYLSDPRRTAPEKLKTVIRHPVRPASSDLRPLPRP